VRLKIEYNQKLAKRVAPRKIFFHKTANNPDLFILAAVLSQQTAMSLKNRK
jgi:hypothetical protein